MSKSSKIIHTNNSVYIVLGTVSADSGFSTEQMKNMWRLADTVLKNGANNKEFFVCMKCQEAEFEVK